MSFQIEYSFSLPIGYLDEQGTLHRDGQMRLAMARDEISLLRDPRVEHNEAYLIVILLAQVITRLGNLTDVTPLMIEQLFAADLAYLQDFYRYINKIGLTPLRVPCPHCGQLLDLEAPVVGS